MRNTRQNKTYLHTQETAPVAPIMYVMIGVKELNMPCTASLDIMVSKFEQLGHKIA